MKVLIAGLGSIGRRHLRNLRTLGVEQLLLYRTHQSTLPAAELDDLPVYRDLQEALAQEPQAVIISNPTALHLDVAIPAARAGCHLLLEKPVSHSLARIDELRRAVQETRVQVLVGYQFRFHPGLQYIYRWIQEGKIGRLLSVNAHWGEYLPGWHPWEDYRHGYSARRDLGGGVVLTLSHPIDYLRWLVGEVAALGALTGQVSNLEIDVEDVAEICLRFTSGAIGSLHLDYVQHPPSHRLEVIGSQGTIRWNDTEAAPHLYETRNKVWESAPAAPNFERNDLFLAQTRHFLQVVGGQAEPLCTLEDGIRALELALGVLQSADTGQLMRFGNP